VGTNRIFSTYTVYKLLIHMLWGTTSPLLTHTPTSHILPRESCTFCCLSTILSSCSVISTALGMNWTITTIIMISLALLDHFSFCVGMGKRSGECPTYVYHFCYRDSQFLWVIEWSLIVTKSCMYVYWL